MFWNDIYNITKYFSRVKSLQSQLSEKEAMLRVYQRSPMTRSSSVHTIYCTPHHSPRPSLIATGSLGRPTSQDATSMLLEVRHKKTGSTSALEAYSEISQEELLKKIESLKSEVSVYPSTGEMYKISVIVYLNLYWVRLFFI